MSEYILPTVKIEDGKGGFIIINESDFDAKKHTLFSDKPKPKTRKPRAKKVESNANIND